MPISYLKTYKILSKSFLLFFLIIAQFFHCQLNINGKLAKTIDSYNNKSQYQKAQDTLFQLLKNTEGEEKIEVYVLLSNTYKRLQDYTSVIGYLNEAKKLAKENKLTQYYNHIDAHLAFAYFDTQDYPKSKTMMEEIRHSAYKSLPKDTEAYLVMQEGYLLFLEKKYKEAQIRYQNSIQLLKKTSPCDIPVVNGKIMQLLYAQTQSDKEALKIYYETLSIADSCSILKYKLYATEVMMNLYKEHHEIDKSYIFQKKYDSLSNIYDMSENLSALHIEKEKIITKENTIKENVNFWKLVLTILLCILLLAISVWFYRKSSFYKKRNVEYEKEIERMKQELVEISKKYSKSDLSLSEFNLTEKQLKIIDWICEGRTNKEIANKISITESTVKYHIKTIYDLLQVSGRSELREKINKNS